MRDNFVGKVRGEDGKLYRVSAERQGDKIEGFRWQVLADNQDAECSGKSFGEAVKAACDSWSDIELGALAQRALANYLA